MKKFVLFFLLLPLASQAQTVTFPNTQTLPNSNLISNLSIPIQNENSNTNTPILTALPQTNQLWFGIYTNGISNSTVYTFTNVGNGIFISTAGDGSYIAATNSDYYIFYRFGNPEDPYLTNRNLISTNWLCSDTNDSEFTAQCRWSVLADAHVAGSLSASNLIGAIDHRVTGGSTNIYAGSLKGGGLMDAITVTADEIIIWDSGGNPVANITRSDGTYGGPVDQANKAYALRNDYQGVNTLQFIDGLLVAVDINSQPFFAFDETNRTVWLGTNSVAPITPDSTGGYLWNSNQVLFWVTDTATTKLAP